MTVYLDNAATTKAYEEVGDLVRKVMCEEYGNPSSMHSEGMAGEKYVNKGKESLARILKVKEKEIYFTSGGTESDNLALIGGARALSRRGKHLITTCIEHPAVYNAMKYLEEEGFEVTYLPVTGGGQVESATLKEALRDDTILVSVMQVNNEIGTLLNIKELVETVKDFRADILFHVDGIQGFAKYPFFPAKLGVDLYSLSGHKIHGPKGVGALYIREGAKVRPMLYGGGQQKDMRPGTENVPGIAGLALAAEMLWDNHTEKEARIRELRNHFIAGLTKLPEVVIHGEKEETSAYILSVGFAGVKSEVLLHGLEEKGVFVSSGSACASNHPAISGVLKAIHTESAYLDSTLRFSFSEETTSEQIDYTLEVLYNIVPLFRKYTRR